MKVRAATPSTVSTPPPKNRARETTCPDRQARGSVPAASAHAAYVSYPTGMAEGVDPHSNGAAPGLRLAFGLTALILCVEVIAGLLSHSLALLADAGHIITDVVALGLAWFAIEQARRPADLRRTYGYQRTGILSALANGATLIFIGIAIVYEAIQRFAHPQPIEGGLVIAAAAVAIGINTLIALRLRDGSANLNIRAAALHIVGDLAASGGVVIAAVIVLTTGWLYADPLISVGIALLIAWGAIRIVLETVNVLLEGAPKGMDVKAVERWILSSPGVESVHDLHVWSLSSEDASLSCHVVMSERSTADAEHAVRAVEQSVCGQFGIAHTTIQVEQCHPCAADGHAPGEHNHPHQRAPLTRRPRRW
mgnify:CR=1 FL=1